MGSVCDADDQRVDAAAKPGRPVDRDREGDGEDDGHDDPEHRLLRRRLHRGPQVRAIVPGRPDDEARGRQHARTDVEHTRCEVPDDDARDERTAAGATSLRMFSVRLMEIHDSRALCLDRSQEGPTG